MKQTEYIWILNQPVPLLPLVLSPLMSGEMTQKERVSAAYDITRKAVGVDAEVIRKVEAVT